MCLYFYLRKTFCCTLLVTVRKIISRPVIIEVPHFAALRGKEREIVILRSDNGESWKEHTVDASEEILNEVLHDSFDAEGSSRIPLNLRLKT